MATSGVDDEQRARGTHTRAVEIVGKALRRHGTPLGLALLVGAVLRLIWLGDTSFLGDQAELLALGRSAATNHAFIITGILSSIGSLNPPISAWLYAPFSLLGGANGPLGATIFTALLNILAIGLLYAVATRYGGRRAGFVAALLYATASEPIYYSRFIWQQNLLPPVIALFLWAVLDGVIAGKRGWLGWAALWWGVAFQLHPTSVALLAVLALALALTWRDLRWRDAAWAVGALALLFLPTLIWEIASRGADITAVRTQLGGQSLFDNTVFKYYAQLLSPAASDILGAGSSYSAVASALKPLGWVMVALALISGAWLVVCVYGDGFMRARRMGLASLKSDWQEIIATPRWRLAALLLVWQLAFFALFVHHARKFPIHYLLVLLPIIYVTIGLWAAAASRWAERWLTTRATRWTLAALAAPLALAGLTLALATVQTVGDVALLTTIHSGVYDGAALSNHYGITLADQQRTLAAAQTAATRAGADLAVATTALQQEPYGYLAQTGDAATTVYSSDGCVLTPMSKPLVTLALPGSLAYDVLPTMTGVHALGTLTVQGSQPLAIYQLDPGAGVSGATRHEADEFGGVGVDAYGLAHDTHGAAYLTLRFNSALHWGPPNDTRAVYWYGSPPSGPQVANYTISAQLLDASGAPAGSPITAECSRLVWNTGMDLLAWLPLPTTLPSTHGTWRVSISAATLAASRPHIGPLALETGDVTFGAPRSLVGPITITM